MWVAFLRSFPRNEAHKLKVYVEKVYDKLYVLFPSLILETKWLKLRGCELPESCSEAGEKRASARLRNISYPRKWQIDTHVEAPH